MKKISKHPGKLKIFLNRLTPCTDKQRKWFRSNYKGGFVGTHWGSKDGSYPVELFNSDEKLAKLIYTYCGEGTFTVQFGGKERNKRFRKNFKCLKLKCKYFDHCRVKHQMGKRHHSCRKNRKVIITWPARSRVKVWEQDDSFGYAYDMRRHKMKKYFAWMWNK